MQTKKKLMESWRRAFDVCATVRFGSASTQFVVS